VENDKCEKQAIRTEKVQKKECKRGLPLFRICGAYFFFHFFVRCFLAFFFYRFFPYFSHGFKQFSPSLATVGFVETQNAKKV
jgi:hypothetical protein